MLLWISLWIFCPSFKGTEGPKKSTEKVHTKIHDKIHALRKFITTNALQKSGKEKAHKHKIFGPAALGTPRECPRDKVGLSPGQSGFVPGTNPGFLLTLHSGSPVCPWDKPGLSRGHSGDEGRKKEFMCLMLMCLSHALQKGSPDASDSLCELKTLRSAICDVEH